MIRVTERTEVDLAVKYSKQDNTCFMKIYHWKWKLLMENHWIQITLQHKT